MKLLYTVSGRFGRCLALNLTAGLWLTASACSSPVTCGPGTVSDGDVCVTEEPACGPGTESVNGVCMPVSATCAPGAVLVDGACVAQVLNCGDNLHEQDGVCVPNGLPDPDVWGPTHPSDVAPIELPAIGDSLTLGGVIDAPTELEGSDGLEASWDYFSFSASPGTYLRLTAIAEDALLPSFYVMSSAVDTDGRPLFIRYDLEPNSNTASREILLPLADDYLLAITDYQNMAGGLFGMVGMPAGGPHFGYRLEIERLAIPSLTNVDELPYSLTGDFSNGGLAFFKLAGDAASTAAWLSNIGDPATESTLVSSLLLFSWPSMTPTAMADSPSFDSAARLLVNMQPQTDYLVVADFSLILGGAHRKFVFSANEEHPVVCSPPGCSGTGLLGDGVLIEWQLAEGDLVALETSVPDGYLIQWILDEAFVPLPESALVDHGTPGSFLSLSPVSHRIFAWLEADVMEPPSSIAFQAMVEPTVPLSSGNLATGIPVLDIPSGVDERAAVARFSGSAGDVVMFSSVSMMPSTGVWTAPEVLVRNAHFQTIGPALDATATTFPASTVSPTLALLGETGTYLFWVQDPSAGSAILSGTVDVEATIYAPQALGPAASGHNISVSSLALDNESHTAWFTFTGSAWQRADITVTPAVAAGWKPEVWVLNTGTYAITATTSVTDTIDWWRANSDDPALAIVARQLASAAGSPVTMTHVSAYDGITNLVAVRDALGLGGATDLFDLKVAVVEPPSNDLCTSPQVLDLSSGPVSVDATLAGAKNDLSLPYAAACGVHNTDGPERFYAVDLTAGQTITASLTPSTAPATAIYLFADCAAADACVAGSWGSTTRILSWQVPQGGSGRYLLAVDSVIPAETGVYTLEMHVN